MTYLVCTINDLYVHRHTFWQTQLGAEFAACLLAQELPGEEVWVVRDEPGKSAVVVARMRFPGTLRQVGTYKGLPVWEM